MAIQDGSGKIQGQSSPSALGTMSYASPSGTIQGQSAVSGNIVELVAPRVSSAVPQSPTVIRVNYSEGMKNNAALLDTSNYSITPTQIGGAGVAVLGITPQAGTFPAYVDLTVTEQTNGINYLLTVNNVSDPSDNLIDPTAHTANFTGQGGLPQLVSVTPTSSNSVRFAFSEPMLKNASLLATSNYQLTPLTPGAAPLFFDSITPQSADFPTYVDIVCSEMTNGASYRGGVSSPAMTDKVNNPVDPAHQTSNFTGLGVPPSVKEVRAISQNRVDVVFNEPMADNADIRNPLKYTWSGGLSTLSVLNVLSDTVSLVTTDQTPNTLYNLSVAP